MTDQTHRDPLEILMDEFARRCRNGESPEISEYVDRLPERETEIRDIFPTVVLMEQLKSKHESVSTLSPQPSSGLELPTQIGNYELLREIGRGGMGVVFEAVQQGLDRQVALKVMNANAITSESQHRRFQREVLSAARLHHTNIVPVFAVGEDNGTHFYSMQYIDGIGLDKYIRQLGNRESTQPAQCATTCDIPASPSIRHSGNGQARTEHHRRDQAGLPTDPDHWKHVCQIGIQVAQALQYAHEKGILHRDVKPQNLLLDRSNNVWITDFGLAKFVDEPGATQTGKIVGTLMYMAPEQLQGVASANSDVYSLGLTLYELLSLRPVHASESGRVSVSDRMKRREVVPLSTVNHRVPRDLETVIMKAIKHDSSDRYQTADEFAKDLQNCFEGRAISARRASGPEKLWKWARRNPALGSSLAAILILLSVFAVTANLGRIRVSELLHLAESRLDLATAAFDDLLKTYSDQTVDGMLNKNESLDAPVTIADTQRLAKLLEYYEVLATSGENSPELNLQMAKAKGGLGDIFMRLGMLDEAEQAYRDTIDWIELRPSPKLPELIVFRSSCLNNLGKIFLRRGDIPNVFASHMESLAFLQEQEDEFLRRRDAKFELTRTSYLLSSILSRSRIRTDGLTIELSRENSGDMFRRLNDRQKLHLPFSLSKREMGKQVLALAKEASQQFFELVREYPEELSHQIFHARSLRNLAMLLWPNASEEAIRSYQQAISILNQIEKRSPGPVVDFELANTLLISTTLFDADTSRRELTSAIKKCQELNSRFPTNYEYGLLESLCRCELAMLERQSGEFLNAQTEIRTSLDILQSISVQPQLLLQISQAQIKQQFAGLLRDPNYRLQDREAANNQAVEVLEDAVNDIDGFKSEQDPVQKAIVDGIYKDLVEAYADQGFEPKSPIAK